MVRNDSRLASIGSNSLSDNDFSDLVSNDRASGHETTGMEESSDDVSLCESEREGDNGSMNEDAPTRKLMDLLDSGDKD